MPLFRGVYVVTAFLLPFLMLPSVALAAGRKRQSICSDGKCNVVFLDEFNGPQEGEDPWCYDREPVCTGGDGNNMAWISTAQCSPLPASTKAKFAKLNKCVWKLWEGYGIYGGGTGTSDLPNAFRFDPRQVEVKDGHLILTGQPSPESQSEGIKVGNSDCAQFTGRPMKCAFVSGGVDSRPDRSGLHPGFDFRFGRMEIRARFEMGPGAFPALWLTPTRDPPWAVRDSRKVPPSSNRYTQEIDLLEIFPGSPLVYYDNRLRRQVSSVYSNATQTLHYGHNYGDHHGFIPKSVKLKPGDYHIYSADWDSEQIVFRIDGVENHRIDRDTKDSRGWKDGVPDREMFFYLDQQLSKGKYLSSSGRWLNDLRDLTGTVRMAIDWVKVSAPRARGASLIAFPHPPLVDGVTYDIGAGTNPMGKAVIRYPAVQGGCPWGGRFEASLGKCLVKELSFYAIAPASDYFVRTGLKNNPGVYYAYTPKEFPRVCANGGALVPALAQEAPRYGPYVCRLESINPTGPALSPGIAYSILAPENGSNFGIYYDAISGQCPYTGTRIDDVGSLYGSNYWHPVCKVIDLSSSGIDKLRSLELVMDGADPAKRGLWYRNDF